LAQAGRAEEPGQSARRNPALPGANVRAAITPESCNENAPSLLKLLLHSDLPNRQGDTAYPRCLEKELQMQAECPDCLEMAMTAHIFLIRQKY
jgi:hypothetical protein